MWLKASEERGYSELKAFLVSCVNNTLFPMPVPIQNNSDLDVKIAEQNGILEAIQKDLTDALNKQNNDILKRDQMLQNHTVKNSTLEERIITYLSKVGQATEFLIAQEFGMQAGTVYGVCCELKKKNRIKITNKGVWFVENQRGK